MDELGLEQRIHRRRLRRSVSHWNLLGNRPPRIAEVALISSVDVEPELHRATVYMRLIDPNSPMVASVVSETESVVRGTLPEVESVNVLFDLSFRPTQAPLAARVALLGAGSHA